MSEKIRNEYLLNAKSLYFIGIGGISMSSLAHLAKMRGYDVSGSDRTRSNMTDRLISEGIAINFEQVAGNIKYPDAIIYTAAIHPDHPERAEAVKKGIPLFTRAEFLGFLSCDYQVNIGFAGMHGKSTATSMASSVFIGCDTDPTIINGAECDFLGGAYRVGNKKYFLFEACEYTDSFLSFFPDIAVVLNVDMDHPDYFKSMEQIISSFSKYISLAPRAVINGDCESAMRATKGYTGTLVTFGLGKQNNYYPDNIRYEQGHAAFDVYRDGKRLGEVSLSVPGEYNIYNALAALCCADLCGLDFEKAAAALGSFGGTRRRYELTGFYNGAEVRDDYAHHPTEITATLSGIKKLGFKRIICAYQPHTYTRTKELFDEFTKAFSDADTVIFADIFSAREQNVYGISSKQLAEHTENALYFPSFEEIAGYMKKEARPGDLLLTMGAGDIYKVGKMIIEG